MKKAKNTGVTKILTKPSAIFYGAAALIAAGTSGFAAHAEGADLVKKRDITVHITKIRSTKGMLQLCLTRKKAYFPDCSDDPHAIKITQSAKNKTITFKALDLGDYALSIVHDENANKKLDTFAGIPKEGIGFSKNPKFTFGPPSFQSALFTVADENVDLNVQIRYFL